MSYLPDTPATQEMIQQRIKLNTQIGLANEDKYLCRIFFLDGKRIVVPLLDPQTLELIPKEVES